MNPTTTEAPATALLPTPVTTTPAAKRARIAVLEWTLYAVKQYHDHHDSPAQRAAWKAEIQTLKAELRTMEPD